MAAPTAARSKPTTVNVKNLVTIVACVLVIGGVAVWLMYDNGVFGTKTPKGDPAMADPAQNLPPDVKQQMEKRRIEQEQMQNDPKAAPPSGA